GLDRIDYLTNASIMQLRELPAHLLVIGGGYIGPEFGEMFRRFGSDVTIVHRDDHILPPGDAELTEVLQKTLEKGRSRFLLQARPDDVDRHDGQIVLQVETAGGSGTAVLGSHLLIAAGRRPNTDDLGLDSAGVQLTPEGFVKVNGRLETNVPGIWALG